MNKSPNILHIFVDQMRFDTIRALGNKIIKTPNIDRLCNEGISFTNAYTPSPVCVAARCSMIYGQYPMNTGCYENEIMPTDNRETFMDSLAQSGYLTYGIGKCHFRPDDNALMGFKYREKQEEFGPRDLSKEPYFNMLKENGYDYVCEAFGVRGEMYYVPQPSQLPEKLHPTNWIGDRSVEFIKKQSNSEDPWYLFSSFIHPHPPFTPPNPWHKIYRAAMMPLPNVPDNVESLQTYVNKCQNRYKYRDQGLDKNMLRCMKAYYYACISFLDFQVGRILDMLEETGQKDNTLIMFSTDHGELLGDYNCFGKRSFHDSCARIPMIVSMPGRFQGGKQCDVPVSLVDIAPTFLGVSGAKINSHPLDGVDLYDIVTGKNDRDMVFGQLSYDKCDVVVSGEKVPKEYRENPKLWRAASSTYMGISKKWKYFYSSPDEQEFLFDREYDPKETRNKAGIIFCKDDLCVMRNRVMEHLESGGETFGIDKEQWIKFGKKEIPSDPDTGLLIQDDPIPWIRTKVKGYSD